MIKLLMKSVREYKASSLKAPLLVLMEVVMEVIIPLIMARLIDLGIDKGDMSVIWKSGGLLILCAAVSMFFGMAAGKHTAIASSGFAKNLRRDMFVKVQGFSFSNIDRFSASGLVTRMTTDVSNVQNAFQVVIRTAVRSPFMLILSLTAAFGVDARLSLIFAAVVPVLGLGLWLIVKRAHPLFGRVFKTYDKLNGVVEENLRGVRVVKAFVQEESEKKKFGKVSESIYRDFAKAEKTVALNMPIMQTCIYACMLLISWFGARAVVACGGDAALGLSTGELLSLFTYAMQILSSLMMMSMIFVSIIISRASAKRICEVLREESDIVSPENAAVNIADGSIEYKGVSFRYNQNSEKPVLDNINLSIRSGERIGIIGGTGSSKSSLVMLIPRLYDASEGAVTVGGRDVREYDLDALRNAVAFVLQKNELFSGTIKENLRWGDEHATDEEIKRVCKLACADEFIQGFPDGYDTMIEQGGANVSGGQKQRLCIARALLKKPKILILDDSTSAVDTATDARIRAALASELPETTKIIIAQRVASVMDSDKILVLDKGRLAAVGTHDELMRSSDIYREVYESQTKGGGEE